MVDGEGQVGGVEYRLEGAWPTRLEVGPATGSSPVPVETVTLTADRVACLA